MTTELERIVRRLRKRIEKRDRRIQGMERKIADLEHVIATQELAARRLPIDVERAVQRALCNVRMIPVFGRPETILEVRNVDAPNY